MDYLVLSLKRTIKDSNIVKNVILNRLKATKYIKQNFAPMHTSRLRRIIQEHYFSITADESTDISQKLTLYKRKIL